MKLKNLFLAFATILFLSSFSILAQDEDLDNLNFDEEPLEEARPPYFALALGYTGSFKWIKSDALQNLLEQELSSSSFTGNSDVPGNFYKHGISAFVALPWVKNIRAGFFTEWGNIKRELSNEDSTRGVNYHSYSIGGTIGYAWVLFDHFALIPELGIGSGSLEIDFYQTSQEIDWTQIPPKPWAPSFNHRLNTSFLLLKPQLNIEYALTNYLIFRAGAGYDWTLNEAKNWSFNRTATVVNAPNDLTSKGLYLQFGVFIGLGNY